MHVTTQVSGAVLTPAVTTPASGAALTPVVPTPAAVIAAPATTMALPAITYQTMPDSATPGAVAAGHPAPALSLIARIA